MPAARPLALALGLGAWFAVIGRAVAGLAVTGLAAPALAGDAPDRTGTGGGPGSTITAPYTDGLGVTKPPGVELGPETAGERRELDAIRRRDERIEGGICAGCGVR